MDEFASRLFVLGWERTKAVWAVPQAFGDDTSVFHLSFQLLIKFLFVSRYWTRKPTGQEWVVQSILAVNHGGLGIVPWNDPTTADIKASATALAKATPQLKEFILNPSATFQLVVEDRIHVGLWTVSGHTLLLGTNLNYNQTSFSLRSVRGSNSQITQTFDDGAKVQGDQIVFDSVGSGAFILG